MRCCCGMRTGTNVLPKRECSVDPPFYLRLRLCLLLILFLVRCFLPAGAH